MLCSYTWSKIYLLLLKCQKPGRQKVFGHKMNRTFVLKKIFEFHLADSAKRCPTLTYNRPPTLLLLFSNATHLSHLRKWRLQTAIFAVDCKWEFLYPYPILLYTYPPLQRTTLCRQGVLRGFIVSFWWKTYGAYHLSSGMLMDQTKLSHSSKIL